MYAAELVTPSEIFNFYGSIEDLYILSRSAYPRAGRLRRDYGDQGPSLPRSDQSSCRWFSVLVAQEMDRKTSDIGENASRSVPRKTALPSEDVPSRPSVFWSSFCPHSGFQQLFFVTAQIIIWSISYLPVKKCEGPGINPESAVK